MKHVALHDAQHESGESVVALRCAFGDFSHHRHAIKMQCLIQPSLPGALARRNRMMRATVRVRFDSHGRATSLRSVGRQFLLQLRRHVCHDHSHFTFVAQFQDMRDPMNFRDQAGLGNGDLVAEVQMPGADFLL